MHYCDLLVHSRRFIIKDQRATASSVWLHMAQSRFWIYVGDSEGLNAFDWKCATYVVNVGQKYGELSVMSSLR